MTWPEAPEGGELKLKGELATQEKPADPEREITSMPGEGALIVGVNVTERVTWVAAIALLLKDTEGWLVPNESFMAGKRPSKLKPSNASIASVMDATIFDTAACGDRGFTTPEKENCIELWIGKSAALLKTISTT